ncbi:MAG: ZIP family metal transporter [Clostridia bacterium]|nr:ZIP family metal transporter [Clostridia bacterium]MCR4905538.1 ZIP family metal transporter [Clostridiales bacterium]
MIGHVTLGVLIPFLGTSLGAACVFFMGGRMKERLSRALTGFAAGIMVSASFFSLIVPALELTESAGRLGFLPTAVGFLIGMLFLLVLDAAVPHTHMEGTEEGRGGGGLKKTTKLVLAVTLHNLPEGMAVGVVYAGWLYGNEKITVMGALALSLGIALQNFPEGAIVSMPLSAEGMPKGKTFLMGVLSGIVEPIGALITILAAGVLLPVLPYLLSFAAGAMIYVVIEELVPEMSEGEHSNIGTVCFAVGFVMMLALDVALG